MSSIRRQRRARVADQPEPLEQDDSGFGGDNVLSMSPAAFVLSQRRNATVGAINDLEVNPDDAAKAQQLARATGAGPSLVYGNLENFEQQHKAALTSAILDNNPYIRDYIQTHPLGSKISNDDWGNLDKFSQLLQSTPAGRLGTSVVQAAKDFGEGYGRPGLSNVFFKDNQERIAFSQAHPLAGAGMAFADVTSLPADFLLKAPGGVINALTQAVRRSYETVTGRSGEEQAEAFLQAISDPGMMASLGPLAPEGEAMTECLRERAAIREEANRVAPYLKAGEVPPPGVSQIIDDAREQENKDFLQSLKEQERAANATNTIERDPQSFKDFVNQHNPGHIELQADAVRTILGEEAATPGDGKFGDIHGFNEELALAERHNGHVQVPLGDWFLFANKNPEEAKFLQEYATLPGGVTKAEGELAAERKAALPSEEVEEPKPMEGEEPQVQPAEEVNPHELAMASVRDAAGLNPIFAHEPGIIPQTAKDASIRIGDNDIAGRIFPAKDAIAMVDKDQLTGVPRALAEFFHDRLNRLAGDTGVWVAPKEAMLSVNKAANTRPRTPGFYLPDADAIVLREDIANGIAGHDTATHLLIHELAHAATYHEMEEFPAVKEAVRSLMNETDKWLSDVLPEDRKLHDYAFKNEHEFVA
jgi:hypothetical protein